MCRCAMRAAAISPRWGGVHHVLRTLRWAASADSEAATDSATLAKVQG